MNIPPAGRLSILSKLQKFLPEHQSYTVNIFTLESLQQAIKEEAGVPPLTKYHYKKNDRRNSGGTLRQKETAMAEIAAIAAIQKISYLCYKQMASP